MKKIFIISSILLAVVLLFLGIYNFVFKKDEPKTAQTKTQSSVSDPIKTVEPKKIEKITAVSDSATLGAVFDKNTEEIKYYNSKDGTVWKVDSMGKKKEQISQAKVVGIKKVFWSVDLNKVLTTIENNGQQSFYEYDYSSGKSTLLKSGLDTVVWDNSGAKIFYKYFDEATKKRTLNIANPDGGGWQKIADIESRNLSVQPIPLSSLVSFWNSPNSKEESKLQIVGITGGEVKTIFAGKFGADYLWSLDGSKALVSSVQNSNGESVALGLVTIDGKYSDLNIPTLASKCVWSSDNKTVYYALPGGIPDGSIMPDDYQENKFTTNDTFWKINIETGEKQRIVDVSDINGKYDLADAFLSATEDALYFTNRIDQKLYRIAL